MTRVLVVDDSLTVRMDLEETFQNAGYDVTSCASGAEARAAMAKGAFALVVLDVILPDADGVVLLAEMKQLAPSMPIVLLSTEAEVADRIRGLKTGADEYVGKPYEAAYIVARAKELVRERSAATQDGTLTVLVIDDSATFREALGASLRAASYRVVTAGSGEEGLRVAADMRPDAIVIDGVLPGIDGATVVRRIRLDAVLRRTPCILLTASEDRSAELGALESGADAFVRKSEDTDMVLARLAAIVRATGPRAEDVAGATRASVLGPKKILAVDDSVTYLQELASQLAREGYDVVLARSGDEALELLAVQPVDCILLDLLMPGLSGKDTCRRIKSSSITREIPLMILTAMDDRAAMLEAMNAGADDYIPKSSDFEVLRARLRAQLRRKQFEDETRHIRDQLRLKELEAIEARAARKLADARAELLADLELKNAELLETTRELEAFSYSVSHDLRAPLRAIDGFARVLVEDHSAQLDDEGRRITGIISKNTEKMGRLIDDLLRFAHLGRQEPELALVDMGALVRDIARDVVEPGRMIDLDVGELPPAWADASLIRQVWLNLLRNAVKYTRPRSPARISVSGALASGEVAYVVTDNGVGFDTKYKAKLFGVFQRLHSASEFEGTGVGLALVQRIVDRHGGWIRAESTLGEGATFTFALPRREAS